MRGIMNTMPGFRHDRIKRWNRHCNYQGFRLIGINKRIHLVVATNYKMYPAEISFHVSGIESYYDEIERSIYDTD